MSNLSKLVIGNRLKNITYCSNALQAEINHLKIVYSAATIPARSRISSELPVFIHKSKRQVVTASYDQVRQPLYTKSVARWKHYEKHLEPVRRILGLSGDSYT